MLTLRELVKVYPGPVTALQGGTLDVPPPGMFGWVLALPGSGTTAPALVAAGV